MANKIQLILGTFKHLPSGAEEGEFESLYEKEVRPLLSVLYQFPRIKMVIHFSGVLLSWIERRRHELFLLLQDLVDRRQVELLGGGFYEPMTPLLPQGDKLGQIEMLTTYLRKQFGKRPQGCWIPALAWEQNIVDSLEACGMKYCFLDEAQFAAAGAAGGLCQQPCLTEYHGKLITVFPIAGSLCREFEQGRIYKVIEAVSASPEAGGEKVLSLFSRSLVQGRPDESPDLVYHHCFEELSTAEQYIECTTPAKVYRNLHGLKRLYFPESWDTGAPGGELRCGARQFLNGCPEAFGVYTKMMYVHILINQLRGDKSRKRTAHEELWKAQDCDIYRPKRAFKWPPVWKAAYRSLLEAEKITREKSGFSPSLSVLDIDCDGEGEYLFQDEKINCYVRLQGAGVFELDYLRRPWNYLYPGADAAPSGFTDELRPCAEGEAAFDCGRERFELVEVDRTKRRAVFRLALPDQSPWAGLVLEKTYRVQKNVLSIEYLCRGSGAAEAAFTLVPRVAFSFPGGNGPLPGLVTTQEGQKEAILPGENGRAEARDLKNLVFQDRRNEALITLDASRAFAAAVWPEAQTVRAEAAFAVSIPPKGAWDLKLTLRFSP